MVKVDKLYIVEIGWIFNFYKYETKPMVFNQLLEHFQPQLLNGQRVKIFSYKTV